MQLLHDVCPTRTSLVLSIALALADGQTGEEFFTDEITLFSTGPISREKGDEIVEKIRKCPSPDIKSCRCPTHKEMSR